jgi:DNA-binding transcriptional LysR family regulator
LERSFEKFEMQQNIVDHLAAFLAIAKASSFSESARQLKCSVSSMSYSLAKLEEQCGFQLLTRGNGPAELTERGRALFREAQAVVETARLFEAHADCLRRGEETRIRMAVDIMFPSSLLLRVLSDFATQHSRVVLQIFSTSLNRLWDQLRSGIFDFGITPLLELPNDMEGQSFSSIELIPVAAAHHPLIQRKDDLSLLELRRFRQLYYAGSPNLDVEKRGRIFSTDVWTSNDLEMLRNMIKKGIGWAFATEDFFQAEIASGEIVRLNCPDVHLKLNWPIGLVWHIDRPPGPLGRELLSAFSARANINQPRNSKQTKQGAAGEGAKDLNRA